MPTHKKGHDKDKYYFLAKDQGYRARSAFKLIQINKRFDFLSKARVCIDLCAAPGGWCQVAAKTMPQGSLVLGVDLLQIPAIRNVKTVVADITTAECRRMIVTELQGWKADVVLCDGAPNIGSAYSKDAYVQNELVIAALKTATEHLVEGGTFCTKVYRSTDYPSIVWALHQLFEDVQTIKPNSSRSQSSEIFVVGLRYTAPKKIDPKLLDPNHLFKEVDDPGLKKVDIMHKKYAQSNKRNRSGYEDNLNQLLEALTTVQAFVRSPEPIRFLTDSHVINWDEDDELSKKCAAHPKTSDDVRHAMKDLRVLSKGEFKKLLKWRTMMVDSFINPKKDKETAEVDADRREKSKLPQTDAEVTVELAEMRLKSVKVVKKSKKKEREEARKLRQRQALGMEANAFEVQGDIELFNIDPNASMQELAKMGDVNLSKLKNFDLPDDYDGYNDDREEGGWGLTPAELMKRKMARQNEINVLEDEMEDELEQDYLKFLSGRKKLAYELASEADGTDGHGDAIAPSLKRARRRLESQNKISQQNADDANLSNRAFKASKSKMYDEMDTYVELLTKGSQKTKTEKKKDTDKEGEENTNRREKEVSSDDSDVNEDDHGESEDDGFDSDKYDSDEMDNEGEEGESDEDDKDEEGGKVSTKRQTKSKSIEKEKAVDPNAKRQKKMVSDDSKALHAQEVDKWFSHPLFEQRVVTFEDEVTKDAAKKPKSKQTIEGTGRFKSEAEREAEMVSLMPMTDKEMRHAKRKKEVERRERQEGRRSKKMERDIEEGALAFGDLGLPTPKSSNPNGDEEGENGEKTYTTEEKERRQLIKQGLGKSAMDIPGSGLLSSGFEVVPADHQNLDEFGDAAQHMQIHDSRQYDSDHEDYDAHDRATTLALGTMMLRNSKKKALVDASYNRFSWNDPNGLPSWFEDDEARHNKPQLPIPAALLEQIKGRFKVTGTKEIKKVAEARMRKRKKAMLKLKAAKKQATSLADNTEMSERQKLKAITKAMRSGSSKDDKTGKVYVVGKKASGASVGTKQGGGKGKLKFVDARMKNDTRMSKAKEKRGKKKSRK